METGKLWFVVQTQWNKEKVAFSNLRRDFECYLPMQLREIRPRGQAPRVLGLPVFPRYLFVKVDVSQPGWRVIYSTHGVVGVLPSCEKSSVVLGRLLEDMQAKEEKGYVKLAPELLPCPFKPGERVAYGVFRDAIFQERVDERRCLILVSLLGSDLLLDADVTELE